MPASSTVLRVNLEIGPGCLPGLLLFSHHKIDDMTHQEQIEAIWARKARRQKDARDGKRLAIVLIIAILVTMAFAGCSTQRGCQATSHYSGYH